MPSTSVIFSADLLLNVLFSSYYSYSGWSVGRVISSVCECVSVCLSSVQSVIGKMACAINSTFKSVYVYSAWQHSACIDSDVSRSTVRFSVIVRVGMAAIMMCMSVQLLRCALVVVLVEFLQLSVISSYSIVLSRKFLLRRFYGNTG